MTDTERDRINAICEVAGVTEIDDLSDGFHTFRQLYYQRMMLFATIVKQNKDKAWKSLRHDDGELCFGGGWFIVGIDTPEGSYTYHYEDNYYSLFDCKELERGKHWDGHTEKDVTRLLSLPKAQLSSEDATSDLISRQAAIDAVEKNACNTQRIMDAVNNLPTVQPDLSDYSDKLWRNAYERGKAEAQPEPQWIPVSERLPEEKDAGILKKLGTEKKSEYVLATVEVKGERMTVTACTYDGKWDWNMKYAFPDFKIVAWMPMPEAYKEGGERI